MKNTLISMLLLIFSLPTSATEVRGAIDPVKYTSGKFAVSGWACQTEYNQSINVHLYLDDRAAAGGELVKWAVAERETESAVGDLCGTSGIPHRFRFYFNYDEMNAFQGRKIYVHGISVANTANALLTNSGKYTVFPPYVSYTDGALFRRNFDPKPEAIFESDFLSIASFNGENNVVKARYVPYEKGSHRIVEHLPLTESVNSATLSYDVKFHSDFEFVKGGKLHGLGGGSATTGCNPIDPQGWSVRVTFANGGGVKLYVYDQDRTNNCGHSYNNNVGFTFDKNKWYRIDLYVKMNSAPNNADGLAELYIDGVKIAEKHGVRLSGDQNVEVDKFLFSTFHGGSDASNSPSKIVYSYFDNFLVKSGKVISGTNGFTCEYTENGIFNTSGACCANSCGSCGGSGCGNLDGGAASCCTSSILQSAPICTYPDTKSPCSL
ncbi:polysaccharide lyase [Microbulbifer sp. ALW1]|uniref:polysaccharide lyase n=1 Tax=Microbulbifer sp. (strain ALW1) TaxID=1516059 RepID=UPI001358940C|nr:hypothetical protein [Microbulbifer sp. ALW1]